MDMTKTGCPLYRCEGFAYWTTCSTIFHCWTTPFLFKYVGCGKYETICRTQIALEISSFCLACDIKWCVGCLKTEETLFAARDTPLSAQSSASAPGNRRWHHGGGCRVRQWLLDPCQLQLGAMKSCKHLPWRHQMGYTWLYMVILYSFTEGYTAPPGISKIHPTIGDQLPHGLLHDVFLYVSTAGILPKTWVKLQEFRTRIARLKSITFQ